MLEKEGRWRPMRATEREAMMGYPRGWTAGLKSNKLFSEDARCSAIGNGFHVPSIVLLLVILFQLTEPADATAVLPHALGASSPSSAHSNSFSWSADFSAGTFLDSDHIASGTQHLSADKLFRDICDMFPPGFFPKQLCKRARAGLERVDWVRFGHWKAWCNHVQPDGDVTGPDTSCLHSRVALHPGAERQKNIAGSNATPYDETAQGPLRE